MNTIKNKFTGNQILITDTTVIKICSTGVSEGYWYQLARLEGFKVPDVKYYDTQCIITQRIEGKKPTPDQLNEICKRFAAIPTYGSGNWNTYLINVNNHWIAERIKDFIMIPTFFHGDLSSDNVIVDGEKIYLIDPNYKGIFGNHETDLAKAIFSILIYEKNVEGALSMSNSKKIWLLVAAECVRVARYRTEYLNNINAIMQIHENLPTL